MEFVALRRGGLPYHAHSWGQYSFARLERFAALRSKTFFRFRNTLIRRLRRKRFDLDNAGCGLQEGNFLRARQPALRTTLGFVVVVGSVLSGSGMLCHFRLLIDVKHRLQLFNVLQERF